MKAKNPNKKNGRATAVSYEYFIGTDVSKDKLDVFIADSRGEPVPGADKQFRNNSDGIKKLLKLIPPGSLTVMESTGIYHVKLSRALFAAELTHAVLNPAGVKYFIRSSGERAKTDIIDARGLARYASVFRPAPSVKKSEEREEPDALMTGREQIVDMRAIEKNRLSASPDNGIRRGTGDVIKFPDGKIKALEKRIKELVTVSDETKQDDEILRSMPGIGLVNSAKMIPAMPGPGKINTSPTVALVGLAPFARDSGKFSGKRFIGGGRADVRKALYMAAKSAIRHNPRIKEFYAGLRARGKAHKTAMVACMRKILIIPASMLRHGTMWNEHTAVHS